MAASHTRLELMSTLKEILQAWGVSLNIIHVLIAAYTNLLLCNQVKQFFFKILVPRLNHIWIAFHHDWEVCGNKIII
jgi:hypothetical protein